MRTTILMIPVLAMVLMGCSGQQSAEQLAAVTIAQTIAYEEEMLAVFEPLDRSLSRQIQLGEETFASQQIAVLRAEQSKLAQELADDMLHDGFRRSMLDNYLRATNNLRLAASQEASEDLEDLSRQRGEIKAKTKAATSKLKATRRSLEGLASPRDTREFYAIVFELAKDLDLESTPAQEDDAPDAE